MSKNISGLPEDVILKLADRLMGTCDNLEHILDLMDIVIPDGHTEDDIITDLEVISVERCPYCRWWMESCELVNDDLEVVGCSSCRTDIQQED